MNKFILGLGILVGSTCAVAAPTQSASLASLQGRYALDCEQEKAHNLSYVIADKNITRLISAKKKTGLMKSFAPLSYSNQGEYQYLTTARYQGFRVDFYRKGKQNFAQVKNTSISNFFGPKTKHMLVQCEKPKA